MKGKLRVVQPSRSLVPTEPLGEGRGSLAIHVWPTLKPDKYGKRSSAFSKWFGNHKRSAGLQDPKLTFHSLRHTFVNGLKQLEVAETVIAELVGHTNHSITLSRYGKRYNLPLLNKAVQAVNVPVIGHSGTYAGDAAPVWTTGGR